jgi:hypothetical protein
MCSSAPVKLKDSSSDISSSGTTNADYVHDEAPGFNDFAGCVSGFVTMFVVLGGLHGSISHHIHASIYMHLCTADRNIPSLH